MMTADDFDAVLRDLSDGRARTAMAEAEDAPAAAESRGGCHACLGHLFASLGFYAPRTPLLSYLMYYHTLLWVVCRAPGE